jgi:hypothetical protein
MSVFIRVVSLSLRVCVSVSYLVVAIEERGEMWREISRSLPARTKEFSKRDGREEIEF